VFCRVRKPSGQVRVE